MSAVIVREFCGVWKYVGEGDTEDTSSGARRRAGLIDLREMFGRKGRTEVEVGENGEAVSGGKKVATTMIPRWMQIVHYVMHAVLLVIIILLIVAIALVESDARSEDDGTANKILSAFNLQVDGSVSSAFDCAEASAPPPATSLSDVKESGDADDASTVVSDLCLKNAIGFTETFYSESNVLDDLDQYVDLNAGVFFQLGDDGVRRDYQTYKELLAPWCCGTETGLLKGKKPIIRGFVSGLRAVVYLKQELDAYDHPRTYFTTLDCDPATGKLINRVRYPSLDIENVRMETARLIHGIYSGQEDMSKFDAIPFSDDFVYLSPIGGRMRGRDGIDALRALFPLTSKDIIQNNIDSLPYFYYKQSGLASTVILKRTLIQDGVTDPLNVGFVEFSFNLDDELTLLVYSESYAANGQVSQVHKWHDIMNPSSEYADQYDLWDTLVTDDYVVHWFGTLWNLDGLKAFASGDYATLRANAPPADRKYFRLGGSMGRDSVYTLYSRTSYNDDGTPNPISSIWRHDFERKADGTVSNRIKQSYAQMTWDISSMARTLSAFESVRKYATDENATLDDFQAISTTDDFGIDTFYAGWMTPDEFLQEYIDGRQKRSSGSSKDEWPFDWVWRPSSRVIYNDRITGRHVAVQQGAWVGPNVTAGYINPLYTQGIYQSTADIFYFATGDPTASARLQTVYMYNSSSLMQ